MTDVICGARAAHCWCVREPEHQGPHVCNDVCGGAWNGEIGSDSFEVVALPGVERALGQWGWL